MEELTLAVEQETQELAAVMEQMDTREMDTTGLCKLILIKKNRHYINIMTILKIAFLFLNQLIDSRIFFSPTLRIPRS